MNNCKQCNTDISYRRKDAKFCNDLCGERYKDAQQKIQKSKIPYNLLTRSEVKTYLIKYVAENDRISYTHIKRLRDLNYSLIEYTNFLPQNIAPTVRINYIINDLPEDTDIFLLPNTIISRNFIKRFIEVNYIQKNKKFNKFDIKNKQIWAKMKEYTNFIISEKVSVSQRAWHFLNDKFELPKCKMCDNACNWKSFHNFDLLESYTTYCSSNCSNSDREKIDRITAIITEKYGGMGSSSKIIKERILKTTNEKYGVDYYQQTQEAKDKTKIVMREKYGVDSYSQTDEYRKKRKIYNANLTDDQIKISSDRRRVTNLEKYGQIHYAKTDEFKINFSNSMIEKYGTKTYKESLLKPESLKLLNDKN